MADDEFRCTAMVDQRNLLDWADRFAAELPPFTQTQIGEVAAMVRQIDERTDRMD